ncbi:uncharacterized protein SPSK_06433 [Sporothrix schenckii 1099-18]|uniref:Tim44-like domain-containing protein n=1 Tax=Sporothrix schenckii 1099-18 TaxID=1397361 RepID=A0A0F2MIQ9_SPOSC|nr:uncharacterized protein SPSK_06433 [Sporothrix schenckii 1099-18]KJR89502.1 hypothetical protein SPSK_06433 [Sporothrix schenckii 1099-18]
MAGVLRQPLLRSRAPAPFFFVPSQASLRQGAPQPTQLPQRRLAHVKRMRAQGEGDVSPAVHVARMKDSRPSALISFRIPQTFVPPPMGQYLSQPTVFAKLFWWGLKSRVSDYFAELSIRLQSKPSFFKGAVFKPNKKAIAPMAKNMHYQMLEATAAGDIATLRRLLTTSHLDEITGLISRRPRGQRCQWELLSYKGKPKLVSHKVVMVPGAMPMYIRQVVVTIRSRQRFTWTMNDVARAQGNIRMRTKTAAAAAAKNPPSAPRVVEKDVKENVILVAMLDRQTWKTADWRIFGFIQETTPESWLQENDLVANASKDGITSLGGVTHR